ncbi:HlyD family efflux transporter periplasmic adaptor subunit [Flavobacteriaceae bacterium R38]|nr:HlyD family efflux transporter periplasmic adaptor subunit [Flavobacteriaceae bacterium R38]
MAEEEEKKRKRIDELDERSDQVKEVLGKAPNWVIRWGITVVLIIVMLVLIGAALISYNDILSSQIVITSENPPVYLDAKTTGRLTNVFVEANQSVKEGEVLAEIENTANFDHVYLLKEKLENFSTDIDNTVSLSSLFPSFLELGDIQLDYANFLTNYQTYILYLAQEPDKKEARGISNLISTQKEVLKKQQEQLDYEKKQLEIADTRLERARDLLNKGVFATADFEDEENRFLAARTQYENAKNAISNTLLAIQNNNSSLTRTDIQGIQSSNSNRQALEIAYQRLKNSILQWEQTYILKSPINGKVTIFDKWNKNQNVNQNETLYTIVPNDHEKLIGKLNVPIQNSGKIEIGQRVIIKLANYPSQEWGSLNGKIVNISDVPKRGTEQAQYTIYVDIKNLMTTYKKEIEFKQEMQGTAEIVLEDLTVLQRIFYQLRSIFDE